MRKRVALILTLGLLGILTFSATGCDSKKVEVKMEKAAPVEADQGLEPMERGRLQRVVLEAAENNIAIWLSGDTERLDDAFFEEQASLFREAAEQDKVKDRERVRVHKDQRFTALELDRDTAAVSYRFVDGSHYVSRSDNHKLESPKNETVEISIRLAPDNEGHWKILRMIGRSSSLK